MKRLSTLLVLATISSLIVFIGGFITSDNTKYNNDFVRVFPPHVASENGILKTNSGLLSLAGLTNLNVYLKDKKGILTLNLNMVDTTRINLDLSIMSDIAIDSPYFYVKTPSNGDLDYGKIDDFKLDTTLYLPQFTGLEPISPKKGILRVMNVSERKNILQTYPDSASYTLQKQVDGLLCTDGLLLFSHELQQIVYTYRYRNQFICLDTNLNVVRLGKTIDTTSVAKISVAELDGKITMSKPPLMVNKGASVDGEYLFVYSDLMAKNESLDTFKDVAVVDVYNLVDGAYRFSLYIDKYHDKKMRQFKVKNSVLIALFSDAVVRYDIPSKYLP